MSPSYTVRAAPEAQHAGAVALAVASLPESFGPAGAGSQAEVEVIAGRPGWTAEALAALHAGARGIVVVNPVAESTIVLANAAGRAGAAVVLDQRWAANPALPAAEDAVRSMAGRTAVIDSVATAPARTGSSDLLADHLAAVVRMTGRLENQRILRNGPHGYAFSAQLRNGAPVALQGVLSDARPAGLDFRMLTDDGGVTVTLPEPAAAWPATVKVTGAQGEVLLPTLYESAHRATWRRLKDHLDAGTAPSDLLRFRALTESLAILS